MLQAHKIFDISLTVLPAYPPVFHMPARSIFSDSETPDSASKTVCPTADREASIKTDHTDFLQHHRQANPKRLKNASAKGNNLIKDYND